MLESLGRTSEAIDAFETAVSKDDDSLRRIIALTALSRCYLESGDFARAADIGDRAAALIDERKLVGTSEGLKLAVTVAAAHYERGDINHARRICERALSNADELRSPEAQAAAFWNTSIMESRQGNYEAALSLARKALGLLESADDSRTHTRLEITYGILHLSSEPPMPAEALSILSRAEEDGLTSAISAADRGRIHVGKARAYLLLGELNLAERTARSALEETRGVSPLLNVEALLILGQALSAAGRREEAVSTFRQVSDQLTPMSDETHVGQLWFELGALLDQHDLIREAAYAFRSAGSTAGLRRPHSSSAAH